MGVLYDYFRAANGSAAATLMQTAQGGSPVTARLADGVDAKGIEPTVTLGKLVAFVLDVPWAPDLVATHEIWPDDFQGSEGPWVVSLGDRVRDALAGIDDARLAELAAWWSTIDELSPGSDADSLRSVLTDLVGLARRAAAAGDDLCCWMCL